jgi:hypothetical protein
MYSLQQHRKFTFFKPEYLSDEKLICSAADPTDVKPYKLGTLATWLKTNTNSNPTNVTQVQVSYTTAKHHTT